MKFHASMFALAASTLIAAAAIAQPAAPLASGIDRGLMDLSARPQDDLYASFIDEATVEKRGLAPLTAELAAIAAVADRAQLAALLARLRAGTPIAMVVGQDDRDATRYVPSFVQAGLGLPNRDYFLKLDDPKFAKVRAEYLVYLARMLALGGASAKAGADDAQAILELETGLARVQWSAVENRDPVKAYNRVALVDEAIGEGLGKLYVAQYFPPQSKTRMDELVANLLAAYRDSIVTLDWMSPATRQQALAKLAKFNTKIGYPKCWIDYATLEIRRDDLAGNVMRARRFEDARNLAKLGKPIDRAEWGMTPQTVNAYYDASMNEIVFAAAYLQKPNFDPAADAAANYGAIGAIIGNEISHGFDDEGAHYDGDGNLRDWWTESDKANFAAKTEALVAQYSAFVAVPPDYHVNGELTLGENIADNSGLAIAWQAYQRSLGGKPAPVIDGRSGDQRFFFGFAQAWRGKARDEALLAQIKSDPHSPDEFRVTGALRNHPGFYSTFGVKPGAKMYLPPAGRVSIW